jgi:hypothetical protein
MTASSFVARSLVGVSLLVKLLLSASTLTHWSTAKLVRMAALLPSKMAHRHCIQLHIKPTAHCHT